MLPDHVEALRKEYLTAQHRLCGMLAAYPKGISDDAPEMLCLSIMQGAMNSLIREICTHEDVTTNDLGGYTVTCLTCSAAVPAGGC